MLATNEIAAEEKSAFLQVRHSYKLILHTNLCVRLAFSSCDGFWKRTFNPRPRKMVASSTCREHVLDVTVKGVNQKRRGK